MNKSLDTLMLSIFEKAAIFRDRIAVQSNENDFSYFDLDQKSSFIVASHLLEDKEDLQ